MRLSLIALAAALCSQLALMVALVLWCGVVIGSLLSLPLLLSTIGLARRRSPGNQLAQKRVYTAGWSTMLVVFYIAAFLSEGVAMPHRRIVAQVLSTVAALDFVSLVLFVRLTARERAAQAPRTESSAGAVR